VELADRRVPAAEHLPIDLDVVLPDLTRGQTGGHVQHRLPPGPEVAALAASAQHPLKRVTVRVHEPRKREPLGHLRILSAWPPALSPLRSQRFPIS
jgi:hypothetical protein